MMATKKKNQREAKKRALRKKWGFLDFEWPWAKRDTIRAARRGWGQGKGK